MGNGTKPQYTFIGSTSTPFAKSLGEHVQIVASGSEAGVVIDGETSPVADASSWKAVLSAHRTLAIRRPSREQLEALRSIAGHVPGGNVEAIFAYAERGGVRLCAVPAAQLEGSMQSSDRKTRTLPSQQMDPSPTILSLLESTARAPAPADLPSSMVPPSGSYGGCAPLDWTFAATNEYPNSPNPTDDSVVGTSTQQYTMALNATLYAYWCNGVSQNPYYVVFIRFVGAQAAYVAPATSVIAQTTDSRGWMINSFILQPTTLVQGTGLGTTTDGIALNQRAPMGTQTGDSVPIVANATINVNANLQDGGTGPVQAPVGVADAIDYSQWSIADQTSDDSSPGWMWYQSSPWNVVENPFQDWWNWYKQMYGSDGSVVPQSAYSYSQVPYESVAVWVVTPPAFTVPSDYGIGATPPSCPVSLQIPWFQLNTTLFHNADGCTGATPLGKGDHEFGYGARTTDNYWAVDLGQIAALQNIIS